MELNISHVRQRLLSLVDDIPEEGIMIVRHGERVARPIPIEASRPGQRVRLPLVKAKGKSGPLAPATENLHDLIVP